METSHDSRYKIATIDKLLMASSILIIGLSWLYWGDYDRSIYRRALFTPFLYFHLIFSTIIFYITTPDKSRKRRIEIIDAAPVICIMMLLLSKGSLLLLLALLIILVRIYFNPDVGTRSYSIKYFYYVMLFALFAYISIIILPVFEGYSPKVYDYNLAVFDITVSQSLLSSVYSFVRESSDVRLFAGIIYCCIVPMYSFYNNEFMMSGIAMKVPFLFAVSTTLGIGFYFVVPACGPEYVFSEVYPDKLSDNFFFDADKIYKCARNCVPSLHFSWALLLWLCSWRLQKPLQILAFMFFVFTASSSIILKEHYLIDLVSSLPFSLMVHSIFFYKDIDKKLSHICLIISALSFGYILFYLRLDSSYIASNSLHNIALSLLVVILNMILLLKSAAVAHRKDQSITTSKLH